VGRYFTPTSVHLATTALKDELIARLREELSVARADRLHAEAARDAAVGKAFELLTPKAAAVVIPDAKIQREPRPAPPTLDLSEVDPTNNSAIRDIALSEMPSGKVNANFLIQKMESVRAQVYLAHAVKAEKAREVGTISEVPSVVEAMIDAAIIAGKEQARTQ
jgi:hypothetical protein